MGLEASKRRQIVAQGVSPGSQAMRCNASPAQGLRPGLLSDVPSGLKTSAWGRAPPGWVAGVESSKPRLRGDGVPGFRRLNPGHPSFFHVGPIRAGSPCQRFHGFDSGQLLSPQALRSSRPGLVAPDPVQVCHDQQHLCHPPVHSPNLCASGCPSGHATSPRRHNRFPLVANSTSSPGSESR